MRHLLSSIVAALLASLVWIAPGSIACAQQRVVAYEPRDAELASIDDEAIAGHVLGVLSLSSALVGAGLVGGAFLSAGGCLFGASTCDDAGRMIYASWAMFALAGVLLPIAIGVQIDASSRRSGRLERPRGLAPSLSLAPGPGDAGLGLALVF